MDILQVLSQMLVLLILLVIGYIAAKTKVMNQETNKHLTRLVLNVTQPALIITSMTGVGDDISSTDIAVSLGATSLFYFIALILAFITAKAIRAKSEDTGTYQYMLTFGNVAFMGFPVIKSIFGDTALFYCTICNVPFNFLAYSVGIVMITKGSGQVKFSLKNLINVPLITTVIGIIFFLTKIQLPTPLSSSFEMLGNVTTPLAMLILGCSLAMLPIREMFTEWRIYIITVVKLLVLPLITWLILKPILPDGSLLLKIMVILAGMPVATNATMMSIAYGGNQKLVAKGIFFTTILCVITLPIIAYFV